MTISRRIEIGAALVSAVAAAFVLTACSSAPPPAPRPSPTPTFTALTLPDACRVLRADILANGGSPDRATLQRIIGHSTDGHLIDDAQLAMKNIGKDDIALGFDLAFMYRDCRSTGVQIPQNPGSV